ncbi:hypothetical protein [Dyadobacter frigoris]|uniref:hypothetical protein n=1 Tax=Dyadobacter frigoris TaxID=2576211 RepID=UPI0025525B31|nr:hypothetical protein [Dyadobacter frigoris]
MSGNRLGDGLSHTDITKSQTMERATRPTAFFAVGRVKNRFYSQQNQKKLLQPFTIIATFITRWTAEKAVRRETSHYFNKVTIPL